MIAATIQKGNTSILVHDDFCKATSSEAISSAIQQISKIVSSAYARTPSVKEPVHG